VTTSTRLGRIDDIVISIVVFLVVSLRNTDGTVIQGANSIGKLLIAEDKAKPQTIRKLPNQWAANETVIPPKAKSVTGAAIAKLLESKPQGKNLLIQSRRLYWRHLNNQFRDEYHAYRDIKKDSFPEYVPNAAQMDNMEQLAALLPTEPTGKHSVAAQCPH